MKSFSDNRQRFVKKERGERTTTHKDVERAFEMYSDMIYRICFMYFKGNRYDIEDAISAVFLKYMEHGTMFENQEHEKAWLIVTAQNCCRNTLKHWWRKKVADGKERDKALERTADFEISETMESVLELPEKQRNAVYLFYYEGYTAAEIGRMYYVSESTVHSWLHKGRKKLKIMLSSDGKIKCKTNG